MNERDDTAGANHDIVLKINGVQYPVRVEARKTLVDAIRDDCGQTGTHIGCEHGVCGACTGADGWGAGAVLSAVRGAGRRQLHPHRGRAGATARNFIPCSKPSWTIMRLQCGFCTPGFLMLATGALERDPDISDEELLDVLSSNLCRCTGLPEHPGRGARGALRHGGRQCPGGPATAAARKADAP